MGLWTLTLLLSAWGLPCLVGSLHFRSGLFPWVIFSNRLLKKVKELLDFWFRFLGFSMPLDCCWFFLFLLDRYECPWPVYLS